MKLQAQMLEAVVIFGTLVNFSMFYVTLLRRIYASGYDFKTERGKISLLTLNRAMRLEFMLFFCQAVRCGFTTYEIFGAHSGYPETWRDLTERSIVTLTLVVLSLWDLISRNKIARHLEKICGYDVR